MGSRRVRVALAGLVVGAVAGIGLSPGVATAATPPSPGGAMTLEQTLSDQAQRTTIAFSGLAFLTGTTGSDSFFPPGKVADWWGFQYLRDNDPSQMGHNTDFLTKASLNTLNALTAAQRQQLIDLASGQVDQINTYAMDRFTLMAAFRRRLEGNTPAGKPYLDRTGVQETSAALYRLDGEISMARATVMGAILRDLTADQRATLDAMVGRGMTSWPTATEPSELRGLSHDTKVAVMTYAGDMFSWYAGSVDADVYFCPERHGTYYGGFYLKDAPAVGNPGYTIGENITAEKGQAFLAVLTTGQAKTISDLVDSQRQDLAGIVQARTTVATALRRNLVGVPPDLAAVRAAMTRYGRLDGDMNYQYAEAFAKVYQTLSADQKARIAQLRLDTVGDLHPDGAYRYADPIAMPTLPDTDGLFTGGSVATTRSAVRIGRTSAVLRGHVSASAAQRVRVVLARNAALTRRVRILPAGRIAAGADRSIRRTVTGLKRHTAYWYRVESVAGTHVVPGAVRPFRTH